MKRLGASSGYPSSLTKIGIFMYVSGFCCMRTEMEEQPNAHAVLLWVNVFHLNTNKR